MKNKLAITNNMDKTEGKSGLSLLNSDEFLEEINVKSDEITERNDYVNEFFLYFIIPFCEKASQIKKQGNSQFSPQSNFGDYLKSVFRVAYLFLITISYVVAMPFYVLLRFRGGENNSFGVDSLAVIRSLATYSKIAFLKNEGVVFYNDSLVYASSDVDLSLYSQSWLTRLTGVFVIPWLGIKDFFSLFLMAYRHLGLVSASSVLSYYRKRLAHKVVFEFYLNRLLKRTKPDLLYTGNKEDRFALIEKRLCTEQDIKTLCIPHGLEYAFKMPAGLVGDVFYCNTKYAKDYLEKMYSHCKIDFVFDRNVVSQMLSRHVKAHKEKRIVFFPESREPEKNLAIIQFLKDQEVDFSVKLHGKDNIDYYRPLIDESLLIDDFDNAISNSICLARKSTVLLEAIYNHSTPIAVLVDDKDRSYFEFMFPSLKDESILKVYSFIELKELLEKMEVEDV